MKETGKGWVLFPARFTPPRVSFLKLEAVLAEPEACGLGPQGKMRGRGWPEPSLPLPPQASATAWPWSPQLVFYFRDIFFFNSHNDEIAEVTRA